MKGGIDRDFYCVSDDVFACRLAAETDRREWPDSECAECDCRRRKWPTPEQFEQEYGGEWEGAAYHTCKSDFCKKKRCVYFGAWSGAPPRLGAPACPSHMLAAVCACAPWGKPPDGWRPQ